MSSILWNTFTGSAPYREILLHSLHPLFLTSFAWNIVVANLLGRKHDSSRRQ